MYQQQNHGKYIKQIKLMGKKDYFPNKYYSPYEFMDKFNEVIDKRYDLRVIEVRYVVSKSKHMKDIDQFYNSGITQIDTNFNNVYGIDDHFMKEILSETVQLVPPKDYDYKKLEEEIEAARKREEQKKIKQIDLAIKLISNIAQKKAEAEGLQLRSLRSFKLKVDPYLRDSEVEVYVKAVMNQKVEEVIEVEKNSKNPIVIQSTGKQEIRLYMHPVKSDIESADTLAKLSPITNWSLCSFFAEGGIINSTSGHGCTYWDLRALGKRVADINQSIVVLGYVAVHKNKRGIVDSLQIYSLLFNQIVLKTVVSLAQIKKIEYFVSSSKSNNGINLFTTDYYLHLTYPPRYYMAILKPEVGCNDGFIRNYQRIQNFCFLRNEDIMKDQFLRLYLFNNTILKVRIAETEEEKNKYQFSRNIFTRIINEFRGTIITNSLDKNWQLAKNITFMNPTFKYNLFVSKFKYGAPKNFTNDKVWKVKYLILVLIRFNALSPPLVEKLLDFIEEKKQNLQIFTYIFWQSVSLLGTVNPQNSEKDYLTYLKNQYENIKRLSIDDITKKISSNSDTISYVFKAFLTPSGYLYNPPTPEMKGRLIKQYCHSSEHFIRVTITDDNEGTLKHQKYITKSALKSKMDEISIIERKYIPLGWSPSQLRGYSLWYINEYSQNDKRLRREQVLSFLGIFDKIPNAAKKAARIGQAFSASWTYQCKQKEIIEKRIKDDYSTKGYLYTDGIGKISDNLIQKISLKLNIINLSVLQVRYKGAKGILVKDSRLPKNNIHLRDSMIKYECEHEAAAKYLDILDWNKYKAGFLNRQTIILLKSLGIDDRVFEKRQNQHIERISNLSFKDCSIFKHMNEDLNTDISNLEPANVTILHLLRAGFKLEQEPFFRGVLETMKKNGYHQLKIKSNIMIPDSARIIGIIDQYDILQQGELYCTIHDNLQLKAKKIHVEGDVIITRNPCLHPADIRRMKCISENEVSDRFQKRSQNNMFSQFVNCIIFPKKGEIPVTAQISGSDLDGDNFFISWDRQLIPKAVEQIYLIDSPIPTQKKQDKSEPKKQIHQQYEEMLHFFIQYLNYEKLGQIDNSHLVKADMSENYAKDKDCIELAIIHGKAVDFPKTGYCPDVDPRLLVSTYPDFMEKQQAPEYISTSVLGKLYQDIKGKIQNLLRQCQAIKSGKIDEEVIRELLSQQKQQGKQVMFEQVDIRQALEIILDYERQLSGLITLVGVDTQYEIYSGNFTIAKEKVKVFGKNRLIATILALRSRYFDQFFNIFPSQDKISYEQAKENNLQDPEYFSNLVRKRALLFYICSYVIKFHKDETFLNDQTFGQLRNAILSIYSVLSTHQEGKFCGFVWFVVPKILINQKYRVRRNVYRQDEFLQIEKKPEDKEDLNQVQEFI